MGFPSRQLLCLEFYNCRSRGLRKGWRLGGIYNMPEICKYFSRAVAALDSTQI